jgi:hypothetical protein
VGGNVIDEYPEYIHIDKDPTLEDIRGLLTELSTINMSESTASLFANLSVVQPNFRLALNLKKALNILADRRVSDVLKDGLTDRETDALMEIDRKHLSEESRTTARALLNVKERWLLSKALSGVFAKSRISNAMIVLETE